MSRDFINQFHFIDWNAVTEQKEKKPTVADKYNKIVNWAADSRGQNPNVFDALTEWILDDSEWSDDKLAENELILINGVFARFKEQNARLRAYLKELEPSGLVNTVVFKALDKFDSELSGVSHDEQLRETVALMFADFSIMKDSKVRKIIAVNKTGPHGNSNVDFFGYINYLKDCDAGVQWALFMPAMAERQQVGFKVDSFEYKKMPAMRFIGREGEDFVDMENRKELFRTLDAMSEYKSELEYDVFFMHHYGLCTDVGPWHGVWGRFMTADTPVPEGFVYLDFVPKDIQSSSDSKAGLQYYSQFAYATFSGDKEAMHKTEDYDSDAMYDVTRNIIMGHGVNIPYPDNILPRTPQKTNLPNTHLLRTYPTNIFHTIGLILKTETAIILKRQFQFVRNDNRKTVTINFRVEVMRPHDDRAQIFRNRRECFERHTPIKNIYLIIARLSRRRDILAPCQERGLAVSRFGEKTFCVLILFLY